MLSAAFKVIKAFCAAILGVSLGYLLADELSERMLRAELRDVCSSEYNSQIPPELQDALKNKINFQCRSLVP